MKRMVPNKLRGLRIRRMRRITAGQVHHRAPAWSCDGRYLCSRLGEGADSYWVILDRKGRVARVLEGPVDGGASFAPDGSLAYGRQVGATSEIWLLPAGGGAPRRLLGGDGRLYRDPAFSPDGRYLCYAADSGAPESSLCLWLLDLLHQERRLLVERLGGWDAPLQLGYPIFSPRGDALYFEATHPDGSAIYGVSLERKQVERLAGPGYRRPAVIGDNLLLCERERPGGESELVLIDCGDLDNEKSKSDSADEEKGRAARPRKEATLLGGCAREPAVVRRKKELLLAWAQPCRILSDEPSRYDLHVATLVGLTQPRRGKRQEESSEPETPPGESAGSDAGRKSARDARTAEEASVWLDRPMHAGLFDEEPFSP